MLQNKTNQNLDFGRKRKKTIQNLFKSKQRKQIKRNEQFKTNQKKEEKNSKLCFLPCFSYIDQFLSQAIVCHSQAAGKNQQAFLFVLFCPTLLE